MTRNIFATRSDLEPGIKKMESEYKLKYTATGRHPSPQPEAFYSAFDIPEFGQSIRFSYKDRERRRYPASSYIETQKYLVSSLEMSISVTI